MTTSQDELFTAKQAADYLHIKYVTIQKWYKIGKFPVVRISPKRIFIKKSVLDDFLKESTVRYKKVVEIVQEHPETSKTGEIK